MPRKTKAQLAAEAAEPDIMTETSGLIDRADAPDTSAPPDDSDGVRELPAGDGYPPDEEPPFPLESETSEPEGIAEAPPDPQIPKESPREEIGTDGAPLPVLLPAQGSEDEIPASEPPPESVRRRRSRTDERTAKDADENLSANPPAPNAGSRRAAFRQLDFKTLDKDLSPEQLQEWQSIYASFRSESILTGVINGVDSNTFMVTNRDTGLTERRTVLSLVIISYRVKILIPETEIWMPGEERPEHVIRGMIGSEIDYVIMDIDRKGDCAIASRRMAMAKQQRRFRSQYTGQEGAHVNCRVITVGPKRCLVECGGYDLSLTQRDLSYTAIADLRREYMPGQKLEAVFKGFSTQPFRPIVSVKEVNPNPFDGAEARHPVRSRRHAVISGKYAGGVFCVLPDGVTCLCLYSNKHYDAEFAIGDKVIILITQYDYRQKLIYARIIAKW